MDWRRLLIFLQRILELFIYGEENDFTQTNGDATSLVPSGKTVCYGKLGCFDSGPPFYHPISRPFSLPPLPPQIINTVFLLYTRRNRDVPVYIPAENLFITDKFNPHTQTRIIIGGYFDNTRVTTWMRRFINEFLHMADENVFLVDWRYSNVPGILAVGNTRVVGAQIAELVNFLWRTTGSPSENFHLIGHSYGAQVAGYAGERIQGLGRITGLDVGAPFFQYTSPRVRLDPSDAKLVDVIHSDPPNILPIGLGTPEISGHLDFFPAGGNPSGCIKSIIRSIKDDIPTDAVANIIACQHFRSIEFFRTSFFSSECIYVGVRCSTYQDFVNGMCNCGISGEKCAFMGVFANASASALSIAKYDLAAGKMYLKVGKQSPYCLHQYQVEVYVYSQFIYQDSKLDIEMTITGTHERLHGRLPLGFILMKRQQTYRFLLTTKYHIGDVLSAKARIVKSKSPNNISRIISTFVDKMVVTYLYPLPHKVVSKELCPTARPLSNWKGTVSLSKSCSDDEKNQVFKDP